MNRVLCMIFGHCGRVYFKTFECRCSRCGQLFKKSTAKAVIKGCGCHKCGSNQKRLKWHQKLNFGNSLPKTDGRQAPPNKLLVDTTKRLPVILSGQSGTLPRGGGG